MVGLYESLITTVIVPNNDDSVELEIRNVGDILEFYLNHKKIFFGDLDRNFLEVFKRALELWEDSG